MHVISVFQLIVAAQTFFLFFSNFEIPMEIEVEITENNVKCIFLH